MNKKYFPFIIGILLLITINSRSGFILPYYVHIFLAYVSITYFFVVSIKNKDKKTYLIPLFLVTILLSVYKFYPWQTNKLIQELSKDSPQYIIKSNELEGYVKYNSDKILVAFLKYSLSDIDSIFLKKNDIALEDNILLYNLYTDEEDYVVGTTTKRFIEHFKSYDMAFDKLVIGYTYNSKHSGLTFTNKDTLKIYLKLKDSELKTGYVTF